MVCVLYILILLLIVLAFVFTHLVYLFKCNEEYVDIDIDTNKKILLLCISNKTELLENLDELPCNVAIENILPGNIDISYDNVKECGLYSKNNYKKGDIVYRFQFYRYPVDPIIISTPFVNREIIPNIHSSVLCNYYGIFTGFDCFINHSNFPNVEYDIFMFVEKRKMFANVYATRDIHIGDELLIDYSRGLCNPAVYFWKTIMHMYGL